VAGPPGPPGVCSNEPVNCSTTGGLPGPRGPPGLPGIPGRPAQHVRPPVPVASAVCMTLNRLLLWGRPS